MAPDSLDEAPTESESDGEWYRERLRTSPFKAPIFLSYSTPTNECQFKMAKALYKFLDRRHLAPRTLGVNEYDFVAPLRAVRRIIASSDGFLAVAFKKTHISEGRMTRRHGPQKPVAEELRDISLASPWIHIEAAMAYQRGIPILILREEGVVADGLLEPGVVSQFMPQFDLSIDPTNYLKGPEFAGCIEAWEREVRRSAR